MKKILCVLFAAVMVFSFAACGGNDDEPVTEAETLTEAVTGVFNETEESTAAEEPVSTDESTEAVVDDTTVAEEISEGVSATEAENIKAPATTAEILDYFNTAINKVKPSAKSIKTNYVLNSQVSGLDLSSLKSLESLANSLVEKNMGYDEAAKNKILSTRAQKDADFPVSGTSYGSKLTASDIKNATLTEKDGVYTITITTKDDAPSADTTTGYGHNGKVMSVVRVDQISQNAGAAKSIIKNIKTGHSNGKVVITVDAATGNVTHANYYYAWTLSLTALGIDVSITFGIEQDYSINW